VTEHPTEAGRFDVYEEFVDRAAFDRHQERAAGSEWGTVSRNAQRFYEISESP
jgi:quinol monooxygenase YgiN